MSLRKQRGAALMAMLAVLILGASWWAVTALSTPISRVASERQHNARILQEAKSALIGHVAHRTAMTTENDPGRLPCPEAAGNIGTANEGIAAGNCTLPAVGRLPWRTLGLDKWRDVAGEPLWYVVSPGWTKPNAGTNTLINSNSVGQLTLDGGGDVVALIIAPGRPLQVSASAGCTARVQRRTTPSPAIDFRDYLECENATSPADAVFVSNGPADSFNDQALSITGAEILPAIEAAVAARFEQQIAPQLRAAYSGGDWPAAPVLPFAAPFADPAASAFRGAAATFAGLLPVSFSETAPLSGVGCRPAVDGVRCASDFVRWTAGNMAGAGVNSSNCVVSNIMDGPDIVGSSLDCTFYRRCLLFCFAGNMPFTLTATASNVGMTLRQLNNAAAMTNVNAAPRVSTGTLNANGSATVTLDAEAAVSAGAGFVGALGDLLCGVLALLQVCKQETISVPIRLLADHALLDAGNANFSWFFRNNWHQVGYYVVAPDIAPSGPRACGANCLTVSFHAAGAGVRGALVIAGRNLTGNTAWPGVTVADWLEGTNNNGDLVYTTRDPALMVRRTFNDRVARISP